MNGIVNLEEVHNQKQLYNNDFDLLFFQRIHHAVFIEVSMLHPFLEKEYVILALVYFEDFNNVWGSLEQVLDPNLMPSLLSTS